MNEHRTLIINALDFGRTTSANEAIARAAREGIVTSASLMVRGAAAEHAAELAATLETLSVGLHFDAGEWSLDGDEWITVYEHIDLSKRNEIVAEIEAQLRLFRELVGREPTHIDAHQHAHRRPLVERALRAAATRLDVPLHGSTPDIRHEGLVDRDDRRGMSPQRDVERILEIIGRMDSGTTVIDCHPDLSAASASPCCMEHPTSVEALCHPSLRAAIADAGVIVCSYRDIAERRTRYEERMAEGRAALAERRFAEAIECIREALVFEPADAPGWLALAQAHAAAGSQLDAVAAARTALEQRPSWVPALWNLAGFQWQAGLRGDVLASVNELCVVTRLDSRAGTHSRIVLRALRTGCSRDVVEALLDAQMAFTDDELGEPLSPMEMGRRAFQRGEYELAEEIFRGVEAAEGVRPWSSLWLSRTFRAAGRIDEAFAALARGIAVTDDRRTLGVELADLHASRGDRDEAIAALEGLHLRSTDDAELAAAVAARLLTLDAPANAVRVAESALEVRWSAACAIARATAKWHLGETEEAERLVNGEDSPLSRDERADLALQIGSPLAAWQRLREGVDGTTGGSLLWRTAHALRRNGHLRAALEAFRASADGEMREAAEWASRTEGEIGLLSGAWRAPRLHHRLFTPVDGRVLNIVGKSLPHAQTGYTIRTHSEARAQRDIGLDAHVVTQLGFPWTVGVDDASTSDVIDAITYHRLLTPDAIPVRLDELTTANARALADLIAELRPAVLHAASDFRNPLMAIDAARHFGLPLVYTVRGFWQETWLSKHSADALESDAYRWRGERELECMHAATHVITIAETMKELIVASGVPEEKITVVPNAVDIEDFPPVEPNLALAAELGILADETVLGYISSFTGYEGIVHLIDAAALLYERGHPVRVLLVGDGEERARLQARARERGIADRVIFTGRVPHGDVLEYYSLIDVFVVPRTADRVSQLVTPLKPYEAMATERAVVVSGVAALREMIVEGVTGLSFEPESAEDLARVVEPLIGDRERRVALGRAARQWVIANRTWRANADRIGSVFELAAAAPPTA